MNEQNLSFHEATVRRVVTEGNSIQIDLEVVAPGDQYSDASVFVEGVRSITMDDQPVSTFAMEFEDGEVLTLEIGDRQMELVVEWNDFANGVSQTRGYLIECESVRVRRTS